MLPAMPGPDRPRLFLADAGPGDTLDGVFILSNPQLGRTRKGDPFIKMLIGDKSATIPGKWWQQGEETYADLPKGGAAVRIKGQYEEFNDAPQFRVDAMWPVDAADVDFGELLPSTDRDVDEMFVEVKQLLDAINHSELRALTDAYLADAELMKQFRQAPAAMSMHHARLGGLLEHTLQLMKIAEVVTPLYPSLNGEIVLLGLFIHDLGKTYELKYDTAFQYTDGGNLVGHIAKGAIWLEKYAERAAETLGHPITPAVVEVLQNVMLSHHGPTEQDFGSARNPQTPEAMCVHLIDTLDAKLDPALEICRGKGEGVWTDYLRQFNARLYRPDPTKTADEPAAAATEAPAEDDKPKSLSNPLFEMS
jgi:3'-5' exoribonuclease